MESLFGGHPEEKKETTSDMIQAYADDLQQQTSRLLGLEPKTQLEELEEAACACCPDLTYQQRIIGYCVCLFIGFCLTIGAAVRLGELLAGDPAPFAIFYTADNVVTVCSSFFLSGPATQCKKMCDKTRYIATMLFFLTMIGTLFFAFYAGIPAGARIGLIIGMIFIQWCALLWYTISYIPYARECICSCCQTWCADTFCGCDCKECCENDCCGCDKDNIE